MINAAGLYADKVAHSLGFGTGYAMLPVKGLYLYCNVPLKTLIYPVRACLRGLGACSFVVPLTRGCKVILLPALQVPDLTKNVLGVHYTVTVDGKVSMCHHGVVSWPFTRAACR